MTKRRTILLSVAGALAVIYIIQILLSLRSPQKTFKIKDTPNFISIENSGEAIVAQKSGENWFANGAQLKTDKLDYLTQKLSEIKTLGIASRSADQNALERYGLDKPIIVREKSGDKNLIALLIGKESVSGSQVYIQFEGKKEIYLAQGNLRRDFTFKLDDLTQKEEQQEEAEPQVIEDTH